MATNATTVYFFRNDGGQTGGGYIEKRASSVSIKRFLVAVADGDEAALHKMRTAHSSHSSHGSHDSHDSHDSFLVEETRLADWIAALLPYFKRTETVEDITLATRNQLYLDARHDTRQRPFVEGPDSWADEPRVARVFSACLLQVRDYRWMADSLDRVFPMTCQLLDDYREANRRIGVQCARHVVQLCPRVVFGKFNIHAVLYESFQTNVSFESTELLCESLAAWTELIVRAEEFGSSGFLRQSDRLLLLLCREAGLARTEERRVVVLEGVRAIVDVMRFTAIRFVRQLVVTVCEVVREQSIAAQANLFVVQAAFTALNAIIRNCWARIGFELVALMEEHCALFPQEATEPLQHVKLLYSLCLKGTRNEHKDEDAMKR